MSVNIQHERDSGLAHAAKRSVGNFIARPSRLLSHLKKGQIALSEV